MTEKGALFESFGNSYLVGPVYFGKALDQTGQLNFFHSSSALPTILQAGNATAAVTYTFPTAGPAASASALLSTTTGTLSWFQLKIIQIITATSTTNFNTTSSTYQSTNLTASITPTSASNKILILVSGRLRTAAGLTSGVSLSIFRGATDLGSTTGFAYCDADLAGATIDSVGINYIDSPAIASSTTYTVKIKNDDNGTTVGFGGTSTQSITLIEVV